MTTLRNEADVSEWFAGIDRREVDRQSDEIRDLNDALTEATRLHADTAKLCIAVTKERDEARFKLSTLAEQHKAMERELKAAKSELRMVRAKPEDVWFWEGRGDDIGSLSCPLVMSPDVFAKVEAELTTANCSLTMLRDERDLLRAQLQAFQCMPFVPKADHLRVCEQRDDYAQQLDSAAGQGDAAVKALLARGADVVEDFTTQHGSDLDHSYSNTAKQASWRALKAWLVETGR